MQVGIFTKTFARPTLAEVLDAVVAHGIYAVQFDLSCAGVTHVAEQLDPFLLAEIKREFATRNINMAALSGTFNMIHPDLEQRRAGMRELRTLAAACHELGTNIITLSTGTRDADNMWRRHPDNDTPEAWREMIASLREAARIGEEHQVTMAFEPEVANVVDSAVKGRRLLDEVGSPYLKVVIDGANVFHAGELPRMREILEETFDLLGKDIVLAHAKDLSRDGEAGHDAAGTGLLDYDLYLALLQRTGFTGALILHSLSEQQVDQCSAFLREKLARLP